MTEIRRRWAEFPTALQMHPFQIAFGVLFVFIGVSIAIATLTESGEVSRIQSLPPALWASWALALLLGGPAMILGVLRETMIGRAIERAGLYLIASAWGSYALVMVALSPLGGLIGFGQGATIATACLLRARALRKVDRVVEQVARAAGEEAGS